MAIDPSIPWPSAASRRELVKYIEALTESIRQSPELWENRDLDSYLDALGGWIDGMDGYFQNLGQEVPTTPTWDLIAMALRAAATYE